jgi:hypothetical protein
LFTNFQWRFLCSSETFAIFSFLFFARFLRFSHQLLLVFNK